MPLPPAFCTYVSSGHVDVLLHRPPPAADAAAAASPLSHYTSFDLQFFGWPARENSVNSKTQCFRAVNLSTPT